MHPVGDEQTIVGMESGLCCVTQSAVSQSAASTSKGLLLLSKQDCGTATGCALLLGGSADDVVLSVSTLANIVNVGAGCDADGARSKRAAAAAARKRRMIYN